MRTTSSGLTLPQTLAELVDPLRAALLVYDMQVGICRQLPDGGRIVAQVANLLAAARARGLRVVYTRHLSLPLAWLGATGTRTAMTWQRQPDPGLLTVPFGREAMAASIVPELSPSPDDLVLDKYAMSAFVGTPLATALRDCGLSTLIVCGIATEIGIDPTLRHAADLGLVPVLATDACGAGNAEASAHALAALHHAGDTVMVTAGDLVEALAPGEA
ncbi:isochorismatase family cysteine hydrolase [Methylobacterium sp. JK268]